MTSGAYTVPVNLAVLKVGMQIVALFCILGTVRHKVLVDPQGRGSIISLSHTRNLSSQTCWR